MFTRGNNCVEAGGEVQPSVDFQKFNSPCEMHTFVITILKKRKQKPRGPKQIAPYVKLEVKSLVSNPGLTPEPSN